MEVAVRHVPPEIRNAARMLVVAYDVSGKSPEYIESLMRQAVGVAGHNEYVTASVHDGGPVSLRVCRAEMGAWKPAAPATSWVAS